MATRLTSWALSPRSPRNNEPSAPGSVVSGAQPAAGGLVRGRLLPGLIDLVPNAVAATLLSAIASPALPRSRHGLQGGAAPPDQITHGVMTGVKAKTGLNSPPSEGARGGCITPVFLHLFAGLGP